MDKTKIISFLNSNLKYIFLLVTILFVIIILVLTSKNINAINSKIYLYAFTAIFPLLLCFIFILQKRSIVSNPINLRVAIGIIITFFVICTLSYLYTLLNSVGILLVGYIINLLIILLVIVGLAIIYRSSIDYLLKIGGYSRFIVLFLFYLPCLLIRFINYISQELRITSRVTYILLFMEIVLLFLYYYFSKKFHSNFLLQGGEIILKEKQFLDTKKILYLMNNQKEMNENDSQINLRTKFAISLWVYVNTPEFNSFVFPIMIFGNDKNPKPKITYNYDEESKQYVFNIYTSTINKSIKIFLPNQRWNNFVLNYNGSIVDIFINGILERSVDMKDNMPIFDISDSFIIGSDKIGINGAITNITYYNRTMSSFEILGLYRLGITTIDL